MHFWSQSKGVALGWSEKMKSYAVLEWISAIRHMKNIVVDGVITMNDIK